MRSLPIVRDLHPVRPPVVPPGQRRRHRGTTLITAVCLGLLCLIVYANSFAAGFALDNRQLILRDPRVQAVTADNLARIATHTYWWPYGESGLYRPLTTASYLFNYAVLGSHDQPAGYHAFNLLVHIANVLLLWRLARRVTGDDWTAVAGAAVWAVIPVSTEAVTNIVGRADLLAAAGGLAAVLLYLKARVERRQRWLMTGSAAALLGAVLAKESAIATLGVLVLVELLWPGAGSERRRRWTGLALLTLPLAGWAVARAVVLAAGGTPEFPFTDNPIAGAPFWQGRLTAVLVMWRYLALLAWPSRLSADYSYAQVPLASGSVADWAGALLLAGGLLAFVWHQRGHRVMLFFAGFAALMFLPVSNLIVTSGTIMGERLLYLPSAGLAVLLAVGLRAMARTPVRLRITTLAVAAIVTALGVRTYARNPDWTSDLTLWRATVAAAPASAKAHRALAEAMYEADPSHRNIDEVITEAERSVALLDPLPDDRNTFAAFRQAGAYFLDKAVRLPGGSDASSDAARRAYTQALTRLDRAVAIVRAGAARMPGASLEPEADAERLRAAALLALDRPADALAAARRALALSPLHPLAYRLAADARLALGRADDAAVTLLTGGIVSGDPALGQDAMSLYAQGLDPDGCAVVGSGATASLNPACPIVRRHSCMAAAAAGRVLAKAGQGTRSSDLRAQAQSALGCARDLLDAPSDLVP